MKIVLTEKERADLLREALTGTIETDHFKRLFQMKPINIVYLNGAEYREEDLPQAECSLIFNKPLPNFNK